jgi:DNA-binding CsgD family transcriptional regulator
MQGKVDREIIRVTRVWTNRMHGTILPAETDFIGNPAVLETAALQLIDLIYAAALQEELWPRALEKLSDLMKSEAPVLMVFRAAEHRISGFAPRTDPEITRAYAEHWNHRNPLEQVSRTLAPFVISSPHSIMGTDDFSRTPIYNEWWRPSGFSMATLETNLLFDGGIPAILNISRGIGGDDYSSDDVELFAFAARHFARAIEISRMLSATSAGFEAMALAMNQRGDSAIIVDAAARIIFATQTAKALLDAQGGFCVTDSALSIADSPGVLERLIATCQPVGGGGSVTVARRDGSPLKVTVAPAPNRLRDDVVPWLGAPAPAAIIAIRDPDAERERRLHLWRERFGLTPAEARFAQEVIRGGGRQAAAQRFGISDSTARAHLTSIFSKTGVARQAELVALLLEAV